MATDDHPSIKQAMAFAPDFVGDRAELFAAVAVNTALIPRRRAQRLAYPASRPGANG